MRVRERRAVIMRTRERRVAIMDKEKAENEGEESRDRKRISLKWMEE